MCGIAGYFGNKDFSKKKIDNILNIMKSRGPNFQDHFRYKNKNGLNINLLSSRLSVIDLSIKSNQPFIIENFVMVYNGEIYNYLELRKQTSILHQYKTKSDTEVIIGSYKKWGSLCFNHFEGMFSIAIIDIKKNIIILSRDICGVKPLYFTHDNTNLRIASEPKVFFENKKFSKKINLDSLNRYILYQSINDSSTLYKDVNKILPGQIVTYNL